MKKNPMNIACFKDEDPNLYEKLSMLWIKAYEEKRYRHREMDEIDVQIGVEIQYMRSDDRKKKMLCQT